MPELEVSPYNFSLFWQMLIKRSILMILLISLDQASDGLLNLLVGETLEDL